MEPGEITAATWCAEIEGAGERLSAPVDRPTGPTESMTRAGAGAGRLRREGPMSNTVLLNVIEGGAVASADVLGEVRATLLEKGMQLSPSDPWREALLGIASDLGLELERREPSLGRLDPSR